LRPVPSGIGRFLLWGTGYEKEKSAFSFVLSLHFSLRFQGILRILYNDKKGKKAV